MGISRLFSSFFIFSIVVEIFHPENRIFDKTENEARSRREQPLGRKAAIGLSRTKCGPRRGWSGARAKKRAGFRLPSQGTSVIAGRRRDVRPQRNRRVVHRPRKSGLRQRNRRDARLRRKNGLRQRNRQDGNPWKDARPRKNRLGAGRGWAARRPRRGVRRQRIRRGGGLDWA